MLSRIRRSPRRALLALLILAAVSAPWTSRGEESSEAALPVLTSALEGLEEVTHARIRNLVDPEWLRAGLRDGEASGFRVDLGGITKLLDGTEVDPAAIHGRVYAGPYPFEAAEAGFAYMRFRTSTPLKAGKGAIPVRSLLRDLVNSERWTDRGTLAVRFDLRLAKDGPDRALGVHDILVSFVIEDGAVKLAPTIVEGPLVNMITSDAPGHALVTFRTDRPIGAAVMIEDGHTVESREPRREHAVRIVGLEPDRTYRYRVRVGPLTTRAYRLRTAPKPGESEVVFGFLSDSREGVGGGERAQRGVNRDALERLAALARRRGARFMLMGGDLVNGYTTGKRDFEIQLDAFKQALAGYWGESPIYPTIGNHEALLRVFRRPDGKTVSLDRWPYATDSAEAVFARAFANPKNGPKPSDPRRPPYEENVYAFRYGPVGVIAYNNNYWVSYAATLTGGAPEGILLPDQMAWIEAKLGAFERDSTVHHVVLYAQEPVFPCGGHVADAMWYRGNDRVKALAVDEKTGKLAPVSEGVVTMRNRFVRMLASHEKVRAVLAGDEHCYHGLLVDATVPIGDPTRDDENKNGRIDWPREPCSPLKDLAHPVWYLTSGGAGAPYYAEETTPWTAHWRLIQKEHPEKTRGFISSSQENMILLTADEETLRFEVVTPWGETIHRGEIRAKEPPPETGK